MAQEFQKGDRVEWNSGSGTAVGTVQRKVTESTEVEGQSVNATKDEPQYLVENENTGKVTNHYPDTLRPAASSNGDSQKSSPSDAKRDEQDEILKEFQDVVNMTPKQLQNWLETEESNSVGQDAGDGEATGHKSGKRIVELLGKNKADYTESDYSHMNKVVGYVHRHSAQRPSGDIENTAWRYSLMNWGHDPLKD